MPTMTTAEAIEQLRSDRREWTDSSRTGQALDLAIAALEASEAETGDYEAVTDDKAEIARLQQWIDDCQADMYINCVYCGHRYGPDDGDHLRTMRQALEAHIAECPKHPLSAALTEVKYWKNACIAAKAECAVITTARDYQESENQRLKDRGKELESLHSQLRQANETLGRQVEQLRGMINP